MASVCSCLLPHANLAAVAHAVVRGGSVQETFQTGDQIVAQGALGAPRRWRTLVCSAAVSEKQWRLQHLSSSGRKTVVERDARGMLHDLEHKCCNDQFGPVSAVSWLSREVDLFWHRRNEEQPTAFRQCPGCSRIFSRTTEKRRRPTHSAELTAAVRLLAGEVALGLSATSVCRW